MSHEENDYLEGAFEKAKQDTARITQLLQQLNITQMNELDLRFCLEGISQICQVLEIQIKNQQP